MNRKTEQLNVCKAMLNSSQSVAYCELSDDIIAVTADGFSCYVLSKKELIFDLSNLKTADFSSYFEENEKQEPLTYTGITMECGFQRDMLVELKGKSFVTYARKSHFNKFKGYNLYSESPCDAIIAKDDLGQQVGLFLPVRNPRQDEEGES